MSLRKAALGLICLLLGAMLGACGSYAIEGKKIDYKSTTKLPPLEVPPDLMRPSADDRFTVPDINPKGSATFSDYSRERAGQRAGAGGPGVLPRDGSARIERDGSQRWLVVKGTPDQVWPVVKDFWQESGFIVNVEVPEGGVMETDWAENRAKVPDAGWLRDVLGKVMDMIFSTGERDKFRTRLERGTEPDTTEVYISHRGMEEIYVDTQQDRTVWRSRASDPNLEAMMLGRLMTRFGIEQDRVKSQLARTSTAPSRATLSKSGDGARTLAIDEQFDRAWRRVGLALDRVGFTVEDRDRSKGLYFVRYIDPGIDNKSAESKGWLARLNPFRSSDKPKQEQYRIEVKDIAQGCQVKVLTKEGAQEDSETTGRILTLLYEQLK